MEHFFGLMKNELLYIKQFSSVEQFEAELRKYIKWYNEKRIKLRLNEMSLVQYRAHYREVNN
jgi:transposase InsO family protein